MPSAGVEAKASKKRGRGSERVHPHLEVAAENRLRRLAALQDQIEASYDRAGLDVIQVHRTYERMAIPAYEKRNEKIKKIPNFWATVFMRHTILSEYLGTEEVECLKYLSELKVVESEEELFCYTIHLHFDSNPFFENETVIKEIEEDCNGVRSRCSDVMWKGGKGSKGIVTRKGALRKSLFALFTDRRMSIRIAEMIKEDLWPDPLVFYYSKDAEVRSSRGDS